MIRITPGGVSSASAANLTYNIVEKLCKHYCVNSQLQPIITKTWSIADTNTVGGFTYFTMQCVIAVTYQPKGSSCPCSQKVNTFVETFDVSFSGSGTIQYIDTNGYTEPAYVCSSNCNAAQGISNFGNLNITFTAA